MVTRLRCSLDRPVQELFLLSENEALGTADSAGTLLTSDLEQKRLGSRQGPQTGLLLRLGWWHVEYQLFLCSRHDRMDLALLVLEL